MIVIDASITIAWTLADEQTTFANIIRDRVLAEGALVPSIWTLEVANVLIQAERRGRKDASTVTRALALLQSLPVTVLPGSLAEDLNIVASTARDHRLTSYDAAYLTLARREGLPLATLDADLIAAAKRLGISVLADESEP